MHAFFNRHKIIFPSTIDSQFMQISEDTIAVIEYLNEFSEGTLRKKNDLEAIFEICASHNGADTLNRLVFTGKSIWNISNKLRKINPNIDGIELLHKEMERACNELISYLKEVTEFGDDDLIQRFNDVYFQLTRGAIKNIIDLSHDLAKFKELQQLNRVRK